MMRRTTKISTVAKNNNSVRTVVPAWIAEAMSLKPGATVEWKLSYNGEGYEATFKIQEEKA